MSAESDPTAGRRDRCLPVASRDVLSTDYGRWPEELRGLAVVPLAERAISLDELRAFVAKERGSRVSWIVPDLGRPVFPKIAVVSWKCFPWLVPATYGVDLAGFCSERMRTVLGHWLASQRAPILRYFPVVDYRHVVEFRFDLFHGTETLERSIARTSVEPNDAMTDRALALLEVVRRHVGDVRVDIAVPQDPSRPAWLVEINPPRTRPSRTGNDALN
ncbi:hypothetical protein GGQ76_004361 [Aureimonas jatrophae]|nr:hypothetical protein [Aureimonas jatrophae]